MTDNRYKPPEARVEDFVGDQQPFYVVAPVKFLVLFVATYSLYGVYWFYKNWSLQNAASRLGIWPVMRGVFNIFFAHALFRLVDRQLKRQSSGWTWSAWAMATIYVTVAIGGAVFDRMAGRGIGSPISDLISVASIPLMACPLYRAQQAINRAANDPSGASNRSFTAANWIWIVLGATLWSLIGLGLYAMLFDPTLLAA